MGPCPVCKSDPTVPTVPVPPAEDELAAVRAALDEDYEVFAELGRGAMAIVYRARERRLERVVAIKVLPVARSNDRTVVERFQREARTAAQLEHPNIIPIHRVGEAGRVSFFTMKFVKGPSLGSILDDKGKLPPTDIQRMLEEVGSALDYAWRRGVVHRDIKPDNILQEAESRRFLVTDFGIARSADASRLTETGTSVGTPRYMSPEQASAQEIDGRSDIYSLGVVAYECLTGRPPFDEGDSMAVLYAHVHTPLPRPALTTNEERALYRVVERMLAKDPAQRFQSGQELLHALAGLAETDGARTGEPARASGAGEAVRKKLESLEPAAAAAGKAVKRASVVAKRETARAWATAAPRIAEWIARAARSRPVRWTMASPRRFLAVAGAAVVVWWGGKTTLHFAFKHGSRCPENGAFQILLDPIGTAPTGRDLDVYYDVCGLERGTPYTVRLQVSRGAGGVRGLFGGRTSPVAVSFDEEARGPASRRHRTVELPELEAGSYALELTVEQSDGGDASRRHDFQLVER